jgi:phage gp29-like protein
MIIAVAGQTVTVDGGAGFSNSDIHRTIRADLIKETADSLAFTLNTQGIPVYVAIRWGEDAILNMPCVVEWDVTPPKDRNSEATSMVTSATAITQLHEALAPFGLQLNVEAMCDRASIPIKGDINLDGSVDQPVSDRAPGMLRLAVDNTRPAPALDAGTAPAPGTPDDSTAPAAADSGETKAADTALNGAQVSSLLEVIAQVVNGQLPRDTAVQIVMVAFNLDQATADKLLGDVGRGFAPAVPAPPPAPAPEEVAA